MIKNGARRIDVQRSGPEKLRIHGCVDPCARRRLVSWLELQPEVREVRSRGAVIEVAYHENHRTGRLTRSARDHAFKLANPRADQPPSVRVSIVHAVANRARLVVSGASVSTLDRIARWIRERPGIRDVTPSSRSILVHYDTPSKAPARRAAELARAIEKSSPAEWPPPPPSSQATESEPPWTRVFFESVVLVGVRQRMLPPAVSAFAVALTALPTARRTALALSERRLTVDLLDLTAVAISVVRGKAATAALITWLLGIGDYVLHLTKRRAHSALASAIEFEVTTAWLVLDDGRTERVPTKTLRVGDRIACDAGVKVPADGLIVSGIATVDSKTLTGESVPQTKQEGDTVMASSVVLEGSIIVRLERVGRDTTAGRIVQILESAGQRPMALQGETERIADRLVAPTLGLACASSLLASELDRLTSVLITDFGTGIRISVPTNTLAAMTLATRDSILVKGGQYLELLAKTDAIVFDKTGTVTSGTPQVVDVVAVDGFDPHEAISYAAAIETRQNHPVAEALRSYTAALAITAPHGTVRDQSYAIGQGLVAHCGRRKVAVGGARLMATHGIDVRPIADVLERHERACISSLAIAIDEKLAAVLGYADTLRPESKAVVRTLQAAGRRRVVLMSGDASGPAEEIGRRLGVDEIYSELLPHEKADHVRRLQRRGHTVAMVGDGVNDAPALALADVGVSLRGSTDVAIDAADVVLLGGGLSRLPRAFDIADEAMRAVRVGLGVVIVPNALAIVAGALGLIGPSAATMMNNGSTVVAALTALLPALRRPT